MNLQEKLNLFEEIKNSLPKDKEFVYGFFSSLLPIRNGLVGDIKISNHIHISNDFLLPSDFEKSIEYDEDGTSSLDIEYQIYLDQMESTRNPFSECLEDVMSRCKRVPDESFIDPILNNNKSFLSFIKSKGIATKYSIKKRFATDICLEDPFDYAKKELMDTNRLHTRITTIELSNDGAMLLQEFADMYIVDQKNGELYADKKQERLIAEYVLRKTFDLELGNITLNTCNFYGMSPLSKLTIDDRKYFNQKDLDQVLLMKNLRKLSLKNYFLIKEVIYGKNDSSICPRSVKIEITPEQAKRLRYDFIIKSKKNNTQTENGTDQLNTKILKLFLGYNDTTREIKINGILLARPNFNSSNHSIFDFLYQNDNKSFTKKELEEQLRIKIKPFQVLLNEINIKGTLRKYLFSVSSTKILLHKEVTISDPADTIKARNEIVKLKNGRIENSRN